MKLLLLGATGRTGKLVLDYVLACGYQVNCLARRAERIPQKDDQTVVEGDPRMEGDLEKVLDGCDAIISVLNVSRTSDFPWASLRTPKTFLSDTMKQLIPLAEKRGIKRLIVCSAWGVAETNPDLPGWFRWFINNSNIGMAYADHERQERLVEDSALNWTIVQPVGLTNSKRKQQIRETFNNQPQPSLTISRLSVAQYLVDSLKLDNLIGQKVVISKA